jgi:hypothetical protein
MLILTRQSDSIGRAVPFSPKKSKLNTLPAAEARAFVAPDINPDPNNLAALGLSGAGAFGESNPVGLNPAVCVTPLGSVLYELDEGLILSAIIVLAIKYLSIQK